MSSKQHLYLLYRVFSTSLHHCSRGQAAHSSALLANTGYSDNDSYKIFLSFKRKIRLNIIDIKTTYLKKDKINPKHCRKKHVMCSLTLIRQRIKIIILNPTYTKLSLSFSITETSTNIQNFELCIQVKTYTCTLEEQNVPNKLGCTCTIKSAIAISFLIGVVFSI